MKRSIHLALTWFVATSGVAQITDDEAFRFAREFASRIPGAPAVQSPQSVNRRPSTGAIRVKLDRYSEITLLPDGRFRAFHTSKRHDVQGQRRTFQGSEDAWQRAEQILSAFDLPPGLQRDRQTEYSDMALMVGCAFRPKPYGYIAAAGNTARVEFFQANGKVASLSITSGWTFEPPNIRVSETEAKQIAVQEMGGEAHEWQANLEWLVGAHASYPRAIRELHERRIQRLVYEMSHPESKWIIIDSVTGEVINKLRGSAGGKSESHASTATAAPPGSDAGAQNAEAVSRSSRFPLTTVVVGALVTLAALLAAKLAFRR